MKKFYLLAAAALCAATATAANGDVTDGWLMLEDFEGATPEMTAFNNGNGNTVPGGTFEIKTMEKDGNASNHALQFTPAGSYSHGIQIKATLPVDKTIADYTDIRLDICGVNNGHKPLHIFINGTKVITDGSNVVGGQGNWSSHSYAISVSGTGNEITIGFYNNTSNTETIAFDNIQLKEKDGGSGENPNPGPDPDPDPDPIQPGESQNGTVTDGWLMVEDFEATAPTMSAFNIYSGGVGQGTCVTATIAKDGNNDNKVGQFTAGGGWSEGIQFEFTLPEGKTIADYTEISVDIYGVSGDVTWKDLEVYVDGSKQQGKVIQAIVNATTWKTSNLELSATGTSNKVTIGFYNHTNVGAVIAFDNIRLKEKPTSGVYNESKNGTVTDGWLMIEDFQKKVPGDNVKIAAQWGSERDNTATVAVDPKSGNEKNLVAVYAKTDDDYNSVFALNVNLPEGKTLKDYDQIAFDLYRFEGDSDGKEMYVRAGDDVIKYTEGEYITQGTLSEWTEKAYTISASATAGNAFTLYFGIKSNNPNYAVDNVRLHERVPELALVGEPEITIKHRTAAGIMTVSYSFELKNYNGEQINVVASVDEHPEVIFEKYDAKPANVQALAANENRTFSGNLKAQHDVLTTIKNPNVTLTATAGEKVLFTKTKTPDTATGIEDVTVDSEAPVEYFNLQGLRVAQPEAGQLYIKRQGDKAVKVRF